MSPSTNFVVDLESGSYSGRFKSDSNPNLDESVTGILSGIESVTGTRKDDILNGSSGNDFFRPVTGEDEIDGRGGWDVLRYDHAALGLTDLFGIHVDYRNSRVSDTTNSTDEFAGIEHIIGSGEDDLFEGWTGADSMTGGAGADSFFGGAGSDTVDYWWETGTNGIRLSLLDKTADDTFGDADEFADIENVKGSRRDDMIAGDAKANLIWGRDGEDEINGDKGNDRIRGDSDPALEDGYNDVINGDEGNDEINGCGGDDRVDGGAGNDSLNGGFGIDWLLLGDRERGWTVDVAAKRAKNEKEIDRFQNFENVRGSDKNDTITGDKGANSIDGLSGADMIAGGLGLDLLDGGAGRDTVDYAASTLKVTVNLAENAATFAGVNGKETIFRFENVIGGKEDDKLTGDKNANTLSGGGGKDKLYGELGNDELIGGELADLLDGGDGDDFLSGSGGNDRLLGGRGKDALAGDDGQDTLYGDAGADWFYFKSVKDSVVGSGRDKIMDFTRSEKDRVSLEGIDANTDKKDDQKFTFIGDDKFSGTKARPVYGELRFEKGVIAGDVNGDGKADFEIGINVETLEKGDFFL